MAIHKFSFLIFVQFLLAISTLEFCNADGLQVGFYAKSCPKAELIVRRVTAQKLKQNPNLPADIIRMHFHDCFVRGCDASVLLTSTNSNSAERDAIPNQTLEGFQFIDDVKSALEKQCPHVVSCADTIALAARDVISLIHGAHWDVPTGRRDGLVSKATEALANLPPPFFNITQLIASFSSKGLSIKDLAVLSGAHTLGEAHCPSFSNRLYNFTGKGDADPTMDPSYVAKLKKKCKPGDTITEIEMDPGSSRIFDQHYYKIVATRRGLFQSDAALLNNPKTSAYVKLQATTNRGGSSFGKDFGKSMVKMGNIGVLTGTDGEIRERCAFIN